MSSLLKIFKYISSMMEVSILKSTTSFLLPGNAGLSIQDKDNPNDLFPANGILENFLHVCV